MKLLNVTGGATQFIELVQAMIVTSKVYKPTDLVVTSASAIAAVPFVLGMHEELIEEGENLEVRDFMTISPTKPNGKFSWLGILRILLGLIPGININSLGIQDVSDLLKKYVPPKVFRKYQEEDYPNIHVTYVDPDTKTPRIVNLKDCTYQEYLDAVMCSSKIQGFVKHGMFREKPGVDGGLYLAGAAGYFMENGYFTNVQEVYSIYVWTDPNPKSSEVWRRNFITNTKAVTDTLKAGQKWCYPRHEYWYCKANNISLTQLFCPDLHDTLYDLDDLKANGLKAKEEIEKQLQDKYKL